MRIKEQVFELLDRAIELEKILISDLKEDERSRHGTYEHWSIKDQVAHCAAWKDRLGRNISVALKGVAPTMSEDYDQINEEIFQEFQEHSWEDVMAYSKQAGSSLIKVVRTISDEDLLIGEVLPWQSGRELWKVIIGHGYTHPLTHYSQVNIERGSMEQAQELQEEMAETLKGMDESPGWQGVAIYNLACFYALSDQRDRAISGLKDALRLNPALTDWSKQDPDFDSIREHPEYLAIYED